MNDYHKILLADDDSDLRALIVQKLESAGFKFIEVDSGDNVMEVLAQESPELIIMDANLPKIDGWTLTMKIKGLKQYAHIPIISLTAYSGEATAVACGSDEYLPKPIDTEFLLERIESYFKKAS